MFDQLSSLDKSRTTWRVKVRITRMWPSMSNSSNGNEGLKGYNLILLDDDNFHVHAYVYADKWKSIADKVVEGGVYVVSNFYTKEALGSLRPVSSKILINFSPSTVIEQIEEDDDMIPMHKFEFVDLGDLMSVASVASGYANVDHPEYSTDVIGVLENFEKVSKITTMYGERDITKFRITDGLNSNVVSVWGQLGVATDAKYRDIKERPIIVILTSIKLKIFKTSVQISTLPSSKIYLNLESDVVSAMRQRLEEQGYVTPDNVLTSPSQSLVQAELVAAPVIETINLKQLSEKTSTEFLEELKNSKCNEEIIKVEGKIRCPKCKNNLHVAEKRYRIVLLGEDASEAFNFVLLDRAARRIIGKTATKLIADKIQNVSTKEYPQRIKEIAGKELTLKIQLNHDNILVNSKVYYATDAYDLQAPNPVTSEATCSAFTTSSFGENNVIDLIEAGNTPGSAISSTKKIKTEK